MTPDGKQRCIECRQAKPATLEHFYRCRGRVNGLQARCKLCDAAHGRRDVRRRKFGGVMGQNSAISWCHHTFNIVWGCTKVSEACASCYAERDSKRYGFKVWG